MTQIELDPVTFRDVWGFTNVRAASYLGVDVRQFTNYCQGRRSSASVRYLAATLTLLWLKEGKRPARAKLLPTWETMAA
jgi:hypothetical protein